MDMKKYDKLGRKVLEQAAKALVSEGFADLGKDVVAELKLKIPGQVDDTILDLLAPHVLPALEAALLKKIELISEEV